MLELQRWPNQEEEKRLIESTNSYGLGTDIKFDSFDNTKVWSFTWKERPYVRSEYDAVLVCESFHFPFMLDCSPSGPVMPL